MADLVGRRLGQYDITGLLGEGGMAAVYRARQVSMKRDVAIKVIEPRLARMADFARRFDREAETIASLSHPHILKVFDYGTQDDVVYLVMELITGGSLADLIRHGPLSVEVAGRIFEQIASALDYAHQQGIIHRDLKPQNVLLDRQGNAFLTDFGIAKIVTETKGLTQTGTAMGTPAYMSPEQWQGKQIDSRSDLYALGILLFEMLSGQQPFRADTPYAMMHMHVHETPPLLRTFKADLPASVELVLQKALAKNREQRFQSASEMAAALKVAFTGKTPPGIAIPEPPPQADERTAPAFELPTAIPAPGLTTRPTTPGPMTMAAPTASADQRRGASRLPLLAGLIVVLAVIGGVVLLLTSNGRGDSDVSKTSTALALRQAQIALDQTQMAMNGPRATATTAATTTLAVLPTDTRTASPAPSTSTQAPSATPVPPTVTRTATPVPPSNTPTVNATAVAALTFQAQTAAAPTRTFTPNPATVAPTPNLAAGGPLRIWAREDYRDWVTLLGKEFERHYNVPVEAEFFDFFELQSNFLRQTGLGRGPDIVITPHDWMGSFASPGYLAPFALPANAIPRFEPLALSAFTVDGKLYGVPVGLDVVALYYNKRLIPEPPKTWGELMLLAKTLQDSKKVDYGLAIPKDGYHPYAMLTGSGGYLFGRNPSGNPNLSDVGLDGAGAIRGAAAIRSMVELGILKPDMDYGAMVELFHASKLAMMITGPWEVPGLIDAGVPFGVIPIPKMDQTPRPWVSANGFMLSAKGTNPAAAHEFVEQFLPRSDIMQLMYDHAWLGVPAWKPAREASKSPEVAAFYAQIQVGELTPAIPQMSLAFDILNEAMVSIYDRADTPETAMRRAARRVRDEIRAPASQAGVPPPAPLTGSLRIWGDNGQKGWLEAIGAEFKKRTGVDVAIETFELADLQSEFLRATANNRGPDMVVMPHDWTGPLISTGYVQPLTLRLEKLQLLDPLARNLFTFDGKLYGVPINTHVVALYYNKRLVPEPPKTWNELKLLAKTLQDSRVEHGFAVPADAYHTYSFISGFGGYLFGKDSAGNYNVHDVGLDSPGAIRGAAEIADMVRLGILSPDMDYGTMVEEFRTGKLAMMITGPWELGPTLDSGISFGVARIPTMEKAPRPFVSADGFLLSARTQNLAAAKEFLLEFVPSDSIMQIIADQGGIPAGAAWLPLQERMSARSPEVALFTQLAKEGEPIPAIPQMALVWDRWHAAIADVFGKHNALEATAAMRSAAREIRDSIK